MRFHIRQLSTIYRTRFQLTAKRMQALIELGVIRQARAVYRVADGATRKLAQPWTLVSAGREFSLSNLGHGWYQIHIDRDLADPLMDRQQRAIMSMVRLALNPEPVGQYTDPVDNVTYGLIRQRDPQAIKQGLTPRPPSGTTPSGRRVAPYDPPMHRLPQRNQQPRPVATEKLAQLQARFNRK